MSPETKKKRINMLVDEDAYDKFQELIQGIPGVSFAGLVHHALTSSLPVMEKLKEAVDQGDPEALMLVLQDKVISSMLSVTPDVEQLKKSYTTKAPAKAPAKKRTTRKRSTATKKTDTDT